MMSWAGHVARMG